MRLELEPDAKLHVPGRVQRGSYLSEGAIAKGSIREAKAWRVGKVEEFAANLQLHIFLEWRIVC